MLFIVFICVYLVDVDGQISRREPTGVSASPQMTRLSIRSRVVDAYLPPMHREVVHLFKSSTVLINFDIATRNPRPILKFQ